MSQPAPLVNNNAIVSNHYGSDDLGFFDDPSNNGITVTPEQNNGDSEASDDEDFSDSGEFSGSHSDTNVDQEGNKFTCASIVNHITVEPIMFALTFSSSISGVVLQNLYIERICKVTLNKTDEICGTLALHNDTDNEIFKIATNFGTYRSLIELGFPVIISLFLGPWIDLHGTKWPLILPFVGFCLSSVSCLIFANMPHAPPEVLLISSVPPSVVGGLVAVAMSAFAFIAKSTTEENRSFRIAFVQIAFVLGGVLGSLCSNLLYKAGGFTLVFSVSAALYLLTFVFGYFLIREEQPDRQVTTNGNCCVDMFNVQAVKEMLATVFRKREGHQRGWLLLMIATIAIRIFAIIGSLMNMYLYTVYKFGWDLGRFTVYSITSTFVGIAGGYLMIMVCVKMLKVSDAMLGILSTVGSIGGEVVFAFADSGWMLYLGTGIEMFDGVITIPLRSMISKIVAKEEIAKVYTILTCSEAVMPVIGAPLYNLIFSKTIDTFPGAFFILQAAANLAVLLSFLYLHFAMKGTED